MARGIVKRGSVVLVRYPFTDLSGAKVRPAIIMTPDNLLPVLEDVICLFISSAIPTRLLSTDFVLEVDHPSFTKTGLKYRSAIRTHKLAVLHRSLILRVLGETDDTLIHEIDQKLRVALGILS